MVTYKVTFEEYIGENKNFFTSYFKSFGLDLDELEKQGVAFVEIHLDDEKESAAVIFEDHNHQPLTEKVKDDWYSIKSTDFKTIESA